jgi:hypothetical protein
MPYVATIAILVDVETETEAMDVIAETMRPLMHAYNKASCFKDWQWCLGEHELVQTRPIPSDFIMDDEWPWDGVPL